MVTIGANGKKIAYGIKHYNLDFESDLAKLPKHNEKVGCTCFIIETSKYYMLNSNYDWIEISPFGQSSSSGGGGGGGDTPGDIIYEGGII